MQGQREILVVDDDPKVTELLQRGLGQRGFLVHTLPSPFGLLARLSQGDVPDLLLLDIHLPGLMGDSLLMKLRKQPEFAHLQLPVVFISGLSQMRLRAAAERSQADGWLEKPLQLDLVQSTILKLLPNEKKLRAKTG